jgi:ribosomal protein S18 acetylase RimI-like enzyme
MRWKLLWLVGAVLGGLSGTESALISCRAAASSKSTTLSCDAKSARSAYLARCMIPMREFNSDFTFLSKPDAYRRCIDPNGRLVSGPYELSLVEESDLPDVARFVVRVFGADAIKLSQDLGSFERMLMTPAIELVNGYSGIIAFAEVLAGLRSRLSYRFQRKRIDLSPPDLKGMNRSDQINMAAGTSIVLAFAKNSSNVRNDWHTDVIASVELRLQPCDAKIPFSLPWIDRIERRLAAFVGVDTSKTRDLQPYLSNLCVDEAFRGKGIGRALVRCVEDITINTWGYSRMYLHVDPDNKAAMELYKNEGYRDVGRRWSPLWAGKASTIGYFVKNLESVDSDEPSHRNEQRR